MKKKEWAGLAIGMAGAAAFSFGGLELYLKYRAGMTLWGSMLINFLRFWLCMLVPAVIAAWLKDRGREYGFTKEHPGKQVLIGIVLGLGMSLVLTLVPHLLGAGELVNNGKTSLHGWQYIYEFALCIAAVGVMEEIVFRGFAWTRLKRIGWTDWAALAGTSVLFGLFHFPAGGWIQAVCTGLIGALLCFFRMKIRNCTTLSLIICHGIYDAMITVWAAVMG